MGTFYGTTQVRRLEQPRYRVSKLPPPAPLATLYANLAARMAAARRQPLEQGSDGNFYGTTVSGGTATNLPIAARLPNHFRGQLKTLFSFSGDTNGANRRGSARAGFVMTTSMARLSLLRRELLLRHRVQGRCLRERCKRFTAIWPSAFNFSRPAHAGLVHRQRNDFYGTTEIRGTEWQWLRI